MKIYGIDFTSAPKRDKPIVVAECAENRLVLSSFLEFADWPAYEQWLALDGAWIGGFDFPFGLPRRPELAAEVAEDLLVSGLGEQGASRPRYALPAEFPSCEGWILSALPAAKEFKASKP